jgi:hypothetical protein
MAGAEINTHLEIPGDLKRKQKCLLKANRVNFMKLPLLTFGTLNKGNIVT